MIAAIAREDYEEMIERGLRPTLDDFDRLNTLALRFTDGAETNPVNFPRIGWAGDIPFYQPTYAALAWYLSIASRCDESTKNAAWFYAIAHGRTAGAFDGLNDVNAVAVTVEKWLSSLPVTLDEVSRACLYAARGFDDAEAAKIETTSNNRDLACHGGDAQALALSRLHRKLLKAVGLVGVALKDAQTMTPDELDDLIQKGYERTGKEFGLDVKQMMRDYDATRKEIYNRLLAEVK